MKQIYLLTVMLLIAQACTQSQNEEPDSLSQIKMAAEILGLEFTTAELDSMQDNLANQKQSLQAIRQFEKNNAVAPALHFDPRPSGFELKPTIKRANAWKIDTQIQLPENKDELAFYSIEQLASLIQSKQISSVELTQFFIDRLKQYGDTLESVVTITEERALKQARLADEELKSGNVRGILHGIPFGVKDLLATKDYKTTWGATPYQEQMIEADATVIQKLEEAGAVLVAKLTLGALAYGDVWFGGMTRNPWDLSQGSSGSSAGSASSVAAGLVPFAIGSETLGSIVSPSTRCGATGLRPTYGRVSKTGAMALSWTMDKLGPIARSARDCAIVLDAIKGADGMDLSAINAPFVWNENRKLKVAYIKSYFDADYPNKEFDMASLEVIRSLGYELEAINFDTELPVSALLIILMTEGAAAFDELTINNLDDQMVRQIKSAWPNIFRANRMVPAVEYINANRIRSLLMEEVHQKLNQYDVVITPSYGGNQLLITNLTGQPCVVMPNGFNEQGHPVSISFLGNLFDEAAPLQLAAEYQAATEFNKKQPASFVK